MSGVKGVSGIFESKGVADSRTIHFGANESREDRIKRLQEITQGNPNIKLDADAFNKIIKGGNEVDVRLDLEAPDRRNLYIGAFASLAQLAGGLGGAAYNDALGDAVTNRLGGDDAFIKKHGDNYKLGLLGGATAQKGNITVSEGPSVAPPSTSNENIDVTAANQKLLAAQVSPIQKEEPRRKLLKTGELNLAQRYGEGLSRISHAFNGAADAVKLGDPQEKDVDEISKGYAVKHNLGADGKGLGFQLKAGELLAAKGSVEGKTVQGINVSKAQELTGAGATLSLDDILYLQAKQKGKALTRAENNDIQKTFNTKGVDAALAGVDSKAIKEFKGNLAAAKRDAGTDSAISVFIGLSTNEKVDLLKKIGATQAEIDKATSGTDPLKKIENLDALFGSKLDAANKEAQNSTTPKGGERLSQIFREAEVVYKEKTGGAKTDGLIGRQHVLGSQKIDNDRLATLQTAAANLTILAGNSSKDSKGNISITDNRGEKKALTTENLATLHNGVFVSDPVQQQKIADEYNKVNNFGEGDPRRKDFKGIVAEEQAKTLAVFNGANGSNIGSFAELANNAAAGKLNNEVANTIDFSTNVSKGIINSLGLNATKDTATGSSSSSSPLKLSDAGSSIYTSSNFNFTANLVASSFLGKQNTENANAIRTGSNFSTTTTTSDQVDLTIGKGDTATTTKGTVEEVAKKLETDVRTKGVAVDPKSLQGVVTVLQENLKAQKAQGTITDAEYKKSTDAIASLQTANNEVAGASLGAISTTNAGNIKKVNDFLGRAGNNTDTQTQKAIGATSAIKKNLDIEIEAYLAQGGTSKEDIDKLRTENGGNLANIDEKKLKSLLSTAGASISGTQIEQLTKNVAAFKTLEKNLGGSAVSAVSPDANIAKQNSSTLATATAAKDKKDDRSVAEISQEVSPKPTTPKDPKAVDPKAEETTAKIQDALKPVETPANAEGPKIEDFFLKTPAAKKEEEGTKKDGFLKGFSQFLEKEGSAIFNQIARNKFNLVDEIFKRIEKDPSFQALFAYGFTGANAGRITATNKDQGTNDSDRSNSAKGQFESVFGAGQQVGAGLKGLEDYRKNSIERNKDKRVSLSTGIDQFNDNVTKYNKSNPTDVKPTKPDATQTGNPKTPVFVPTTLEKTNKTKFNDELYQPDTSRKLAANITQFFKSNE